MFYISEYIMARVRHGASGFNGLLQNTVLYNMAQTRSSYLIPKGSYLAYIKGNVAVYKDLNIVTVTIKRYISREHSERI